MTAPIVDVSIVIPSYETGALLARCLEAVAQSARACPEVVSEVIVVDNGSRDGSADYARRAGARGPISTAGELSCRYSEMSTWWGGATIR